MILRTILVQRTEWKQIKSVLKAKTMASCSNNSPSIRHDNTEYRNVLLDIKSQNDLLYCCAKKVFPEYKHCKSRKPADIKTEVLASLSVRSVVNEMVGRKIWSSSRAEKEALNILNTMAHLFDMKALRALAYPTKKVLQDVYSGVYVNEGAIEPIKSLCQSNPVIFLPSHRSYMDFVLMHVLCYHYALPVPAIATGQDFLQLKLLAEWMRRCGAFFIRRSFSEDPLYRAIFNSYVQSHIINGDRTIEAFVEGARSRTGKSLHPKHGFLMTAVEPFLTNRIFDLYLVPVNISYDKILEETLYASEVLGSTKPRETALSLFKARSILGTNYGNAYVSFSEPISVRHFFGQPSAPWRINRSVHSVPSSVFEPMPDEINAVRSLAHRVIKRQEAGAVVGIWPFVSLVLTKLTAYDQENIFTVHLSTLTEEVSRLIDLARRLDHSVFVEPDENLQYAIVEQSKLHGNVLQFDPSTLHFSLKPCRPSSALPSDQSNRLLASVVGDSVEFLLSHTILGHYSNQCLHFFAPLSYLAASFNADASSDEKSIPVGVLRERFDVLQRLLSREFVVDLLTEKCNFKAALELGAKANVFRVQGDLVSVKRHSDIRELKFVLEPFMIVYYVCIDFLSTLNENHVTERDYVNQIQAALAGKLKYSGESFFAPRWFRTLSMETIKNCLQVLLDMGVVQKIKTPSPAQTPFFAVLEAYKLNDLKTTLKDLMDNFYDTEESDEGDTTLMAKVEGQEQTTDQLGKMRIRSKL